MQNWVTRWKELAAPQKLPTELFFGLTAEITRQLHMNGWATFEWAAACPVAGLPNFGFTVWADEEDGLVMQGFSGNEVDEVVLLTDANLQRRFALACWCIAEFAPEAREALVGEIIQHASLRLDCLPEPAKLFLNVP